MFRTALLAPARFHYIEMTKTPKGLREDKGVRAFAQQELARDLRSARPGQRPVSYTTGGHGIVLSVRTPLRLHASGRNCTLFVVMVSDAVVSFGPGQGSV